MSVGQPCEYFLDGYRYGVIRELPEKGPHAGAAKVENPAPRWTRDNSTGKWTPAPRTTVWVPVEHVWEVGTPPPDCVGLRAYLNAEEVKEREKEKRDEQRAANERREKLTAKVFRRKG